MLLRLRTSRRGNNTCRMIGKCGQEETEMVPGVLSYKGVGGWTTLNSLVLSLIFCALLTKFWAFRMGTISQDCSKNYIMRWFWSL